MSGKFLTHCDFKLL